MFSKIRDNLQKFFVIWFIVIFINQIFIFGGCFAPYCLIAALPHTGFISGLIVYFLIKEESTLIDNKIKNRTVDYSLYGKDISKLAEKLSKTKVSRKARNEIICPKCGSKMILKTAKRGKYKGNKFWGCSKFPDCKSIKEVNV